MIKNINFHLNQSKKKKEMRKLGSRLYPFLLLFYFGLVLEASMSMYLKVAFIAFFYAISYGFKVLFFDKNVLDYVPFATTIAIIFWLYVTYFLNFAAIMFNLSLYNLFFIFSTGMSWYCLYKAYKTDPGVLSGNNHDQMNQVRNIFIF